jgi:Protein of unknown function (DUF4245)
MALSLLVLVIPVLLIVVTYRFLHNGDQPVIIDPAATIAQAKAANRFPVAEPAGLDAGWRTVSAVFRTTEDGATLRLGYLSPTGAGLQVVESDVPSGTLLAAELGADARALGSDQVDGHEWRRYTARKGENALVLAEPGRTVVVIGGAPLDQVRTLAASVS